MKREIKFRAGEHSIETVDAPTDGRGAHNFKGFEVSGGYVLRKVIGHPNANSRGYYPEHRLVMEEHLGRLLLPDEVVHHIDGKRKNNDLSNLKVVTQSEHAGMEHVGKRNPNGTMAASDPIFDQIKFRLHDTDRGVTSIFTLSKLIGTTFRRGKFQFRGRFTGLHDKNGKEIYEGDIVRWGMDGLEHEVRLATVRIDPDIQFVRFNPPANLKEREAYEYIFHFGNFVYSNEIDKVMEIIGNVYENPELCPKTS